MHAKEKVQCNRFFLVYVPIEETYEEADHYFWSKILASVELR